MKMSDSRRSVQIIEVQHASVVAAIATSEGPRAIIEAGLVDALASDFHQRMYTGATLLRCI